ncbi:MAG: pyrimidine-nucleoside phosphorylase [Erysipelotrichales bacterium]
MNIVNIIAKKRDKIELNQEEIEFFVNGVTNQSIADYQISSLLMAIVLNGMSNQEVIYLTQAMLHSGDVIDLSRIEGIKCDKHSTGGVGDKVTLVLAPLLASCGATVSKMSGRGLGHTGGTLDKLESIPNFRVDLSIDEFINQVNDIKVSVIGQTGNLVPADKAIYALRDVTGTVQSIPLIASSIMSKKLASGSDAILLDVKVGEGAFMKDIDQARQLAGVMVEIGKGLNKDVKAVITDMNQPLGYSIGNALEVKEAIATLNGEGPKDLEDLCIRLGSMMLVQAKEYTNEEDAAKILKENLYNGKAIAKFVELVKAQGGDQTYIEDPSKFEMASNIIEVKTDKEGYLYQLDALGVAQVALELGAGRHTKEEAIDYPAGIVLTKKVNDKVAKGDVIAYMHTNKETDEKLIKMLQDSLIVKDQKHEDTSLIKEIIK